MNVRKVLDYVAAAVFALKGAWPNAKAVVSADKEFRLLKNDFKEDRKNNMLLSNSVDIKEIVSYSIIKRYYIDGVKKFSDL